MCVRRVLLQLSGEHNPLTLSPLKLRDSEKQKADFCCLCVQYLPGGTACRSSTDECDLAEYCNGSSSLCQSDVFIQVRPGISYLKRTCVSALDPDCCLCFRMGSRAGTSRPTVIMGNVSTMTGSVRPYSDPVCTTTCSYIPSPLL